MNETKPADEVLTLYNWPTSTCSQKVRLVLAEKSLSYEDRRLNFEQERESCRTGTSNSTRTASCRHSGHGSKIIIDLSVITEYLEEVFPRVRLSPADAYRRARMRVWRQFIDEVPTPAIRVPSYNRYIRHKWQTMTQEDFDALVAKRTVRKHFIARWAATARAPRRSAT